MTDAAASATRYRVLACGIGPGIVRDSERHTLTRRDGHAPRDRCDQPRELLRGRRHGGHEAKATTRLRREHAVEDERMEVDVQVARTARPLDCGHGSRLAFGNPLPASAAPIERA